MVRHSVCLQCHGECGLRAKVNRKTGKLERLQGNPYHPNTLIDYKDMNIPVVDTANTPGTVCPRERGSTNSLRPISTDSSPETLWPERVINGYLLSGKTDR
jgi:tetrathionate reductase subunit A